MSDWFAGNGSSKAVDVAALWDSGALEVFTELVQLGSLVSIGITSDGGALGVTVTLDGRWRREYFRDSDELTSWLIGARNGVKDAIEREDASSGPRKRSRSRQRAT